MGGIAGNLNFEDREPLARPVLEQMLELPSHASPITTRALYEAPGITLGASGPSDVVSAAEGDLLQVVVDADLTHGEALRAELRAFTFVPAGASHAELVRLAYHAWGPRFVDHVRGAFACAIWDGRTRRLLLARDHAGLRPLFFSIVPGAGVTFASSLRTLLRHPAIGREWCPSAIDAYLALGYVPAPLTPYRRVSKLDAGHLLVVEGRRLHLEAYWDLPRVRDEGEGGRAAVDLVADVADRLTHVVRGVRDGASDGLLYSGGVASTALLAASPAGAVTPITVDLDQDPTDLVRSGRAADALGHRRLVVSTAGHARDLAQRLVAQSDAPLADPSAIEQLAICDAAGRHVTTALAAHGAAALWGGHAGRVAPITATMRRWLAAPLAAAGDGPARALPAAASTVMRAHGVWDDARRRALYTRQFAWNVRASDPFARHRELSAALDAADPRDRARYVDAHTTVPDSLVAAAEAAARAAGLRLRYPMLDRELVEHAAAVPGALTQRGAAGTAALRTLLARPLPAPLLPPARRAPAVHAWLPGALDALVPGVLLGPRFDSRGLVSRPALRRVWDEHHTGTRGHGGRLWSLLMLELWLREHVDGDAADAPLEYAVLKVA